MTQQTAAAPATTTATTPSGLRSLYLIRVVFSLTWVILVFTTCASLKSKDTPTAIAAVLLTIYPLWDAVATLLERRLAGVFSTIGSALLVFGIWALLSGALQLTVAIRRWRTVGAQWPMVISGGLSVFAGASFAIMSGSKTSGLSTVAGYSAFGAFWFLVSVITLSLRARRERR